MATLRINQLPLNSTPTGAANIAIDGSATERTTLQAVIDELALQPSDIGVSVQAYSANLDTWSGLSASSYYTSAQVDANFQPLDATLTALAGLTTAANQLIYATGANAFAMTGLTSFARTLLDDADASTARATLEVVIGTDVQAHDAGLDDVAGLTPTNGNIIVGDGSNWVAESGGTARTSLGLAIGSDVQAYAANLDGWAAEDPGDYSTTAEIAAAYQPLDGDLTAIAALSTTAAGRSSLTIADPNADRVMAWDDSAGAVVPIALADISSEASPAAGDFLLMYRAEGDLAKVDWDDLPSGGGGGGEVAVAADRTALASVNTSTYKIAFLQEAGREGIFEWDSSDLSAEVTSDTQQGIYVPPSGDTTGASGAWVRSFDGSISVKWFGATGDAVTRADGAISASANTFTSASSTFTSADVGKYIEVSGAGAAGATLVTTIASINSSTSVELADAASATVSGGAFIYATSGDLVAWQAAADAATTIIDYIGAYARVEKSVFAPAGSYFFPSGGTCRCKRGLVIKGEGRAATWVYHGGGDVPVFDTDDDPMVTANLEINLEALSIIGAPEGGTTAGVKFNNDIRNGGLRDVSIHGCVDNVWLDDCWTFVVDRCDLQGATRNNIRWFNATAGTIRESRIDGAGEDNIFIGTSTENPGFNTIQLVLYQSYIQFAQRNGILMEDVNIAHIIGGYFEGNNKSGGAYADIKHVDGSATEGFLFSISGVYASAAGAGAANSRFIDIKRGAVVLNGCLNYNGGNYDVAVALGTGVTRFTNVGSLLAANSTRIQRASASTIVCDLWDGSGNGSIETSGELAFNTQGNGYWKFNSPGNRRNELRLQSGGVDKWFIGRGDTDEPLADDFYIARSSGGGGTPSLRIADGADVVYVQSLNIVVVPTYENDAAAGGGGLTAGAVYKTATGEMRIKL